MFRRFTLVTLNNLHARQISSAQYIVAGTTTGTRTATTIPPPPQTGATPKWDLYAGVLVERLPIVTKTFTNLEKEFQELLWRIEYENSLKSNHELQHERELAQRELIKKGQLEVDLDDSATKQTAQDLKDAYTEELKKFQFASRTTADDAKNVVTSTDRCLEDSLYLIIQEKFGNQTHYLLPQGKRQDGETMRQTAERVVREKCGTQLQVHFNGNAPCGFYKYKYPNAMRQQSVGAKVFFFHAILKEGNLSQDKASSIANFEWLNKEQLEQKFTSGAYAESVGKFIL